MESSEDDAGNATSASCRASAREKDIGQAENVEPTNYTLHEPPEASVSGRTRTMSEDNFDGDSVPSPSPQDVNTSTEAILDMIDEFVDGPGAPKRLPLRTTASSALNATLEPVVLLETEPKQQTHDLAEQSRTLPAASIDESETVNESASEKLVECTPHIEDSICANTSSNINSPQVSSASVDKIETLSNQQTDYNSVVISAEPQLLAVQVVSDSPSSSIQTVQNISNISECEQSEQLERTVKCVTSSDHRDSVTVERAESTSSECSVSEIKGFPVEPSSRSPLKRRLVRPAPSDRRPDSTVSSTVDSNIHLTHPPSYDVVAKDVSSSSDAVPHQHGKVKPEEISKVSEISFCKAETSTAPKKIRLVRPKVTPALSNSVKTPEALTPAKKQCQSTSDDSASPIFPVEPATNWVDSVKYVDNVSIQVPETITYAKISEAQEIATSSIESATPSVRTILPSESTTIQSEELKEAPSEVLSISIEPSQVQSKMELLTNIPPKKLELKKSDVTVISNSKEKLNPTEPAQIQLKEESIEVKISQDLESCKLVNKITIPDLTEISNDVSLIEQSEVQSTRLLASHGQSQECVIQSQSEQSKSEQIELKRPKTSESQSNVQKPAEILFKERDKPSESQSKDQKPIEGYPKVVETTFIDTLPTKNSSKKFETDFTSKIFEPTHDQAESIPTGSQSKVLGQTKVQSVVEESEKSPKVPDSIENQLKGLRTTKSLLQVQEPTESLPIVLTQKNESLQEVQCSLNTLPKCQPETQGPAEELKPAVSESKQLKLTETQKSAESKSKAIASAVVIKPAESELKACEPAEVKPAESETKAYEPAEVLKLAKSESKALLSTKVIKLAESEPTLSQPTKRIEPKSCEPAEVKLTESDAIAYEPAEVKLAESEPKGYKLAEVKPAESEPKAYESAEVQPAESEPKACEPSEVKPAESELKAYKAAEIKLAESEPKACEPSEVKPAESELKAYMAAEIKLAESEPKACEPVEVKPGESEPKAYEPAVVKPAECEPKACEPAEVKLAKSEPKALLSTKVIKPAGSEPKVLECVDILKPVDSKSEVLKTVTVMKPTKIEPKACEPSVVLKPAQSESDVLKPKEVIKPAESDPKVLESVEILKPTGNESKALEHTGKRKPAESKSNVLHSTKVLKPMESQSKALEPAEVMKPAEIVPKACESGEVLKLADSESKTLLPTKVIKPAENKSQVLEPADVDKPAECVLTPPESSKKLESVKSESKHFKPESSHQKETPEPVLMPKVPKVEKPHSTELKATEDRLLDQIQSQSEQSNSELNQSKDMKLETAQLEQTKEKPSKLKKTNIYSEKIENMEVDSEIKELKEKKPLEEVSNELGRVGPMESLPMDVQSESRQQQHLEAKSNALDEGRKLPPIKLTLTKVLKADKKTNDSEAQSICKNTVVSSYQDKQVSASNTGITYNCDSSSKSDDMLVDHKKVRPIRLNISTTDHSSSFQSSAQKINVVEETPDSTKQVPKLTIKLGHKPAEEMKSPIPKLTIKPIRPPIDQMPEGSFENNQQIPVVTKLNIKPIVKPLEGNDSLAATNLNDQAIRKEKIPSVTKLNIKPIHKPAEKINDMHRKSSSSEISESEYSENDETSTSDQTSASDQGPSDTVPKVTIKLGKPGTESEGKFYTEKNIPKLTIRGFQQNEYDEKDAKLKLVISQSEDKTMDKVPKLTIKTITKSESQPLSPKLTIKPIKAPENDTEIPNFKITTEALGTSSDIKENMQVPKITIKAVTKTDSETNTKSPKISTLICDSPDQIPIVTKLNIKPILKPMENAESSEELVDKVPVVSKLNIKPIIKPKDNKIDSSVEDVPKIIKLNIKPVKNPEENSSGGKDCDENIVDIGEKSIPVVTKLNIKPIFKPEEDEGLKDSENQSSETGTSSDDNSDHIPVVTKLNIKPIVKPIEMEEVIKPIPNDQNIPVVTKLNIKPLVKPEENVSSSSPKRESLKSPGGSGNSKSKLNIKPIVKHEDTSENKHDDNLDKSTKNPPLVMKINMKNVCDSVLDQKFNSHVDGTKSPRQPMSPKVKKSTLTPDRDNPKSNVELRKNIGSSPDSSNMTFTMSHETNAHLNFLLEKNDLSCSKELKSLPVEVKQVPDKTSNNKINVQINEVHEKKPDLIVSPLSPGLAKQRKSLQNCTLLKQLLSNTKDDSEKSREMSVSNCLPNFEKSDAPLTNCNATTSVKTLVDEIRKNNSDLSAEFGRRSPISESSNDLSHLNKSLKTRTIQEIRKDANESVTKPLEIITEKVSNQSSGQDSPRIILKINKTDHGPSSKIITEESHKPKDSPPQNHIENTHETVPVKQSPKKYVNSKKKLATDEAVSLTIGKRLRSSRVVETPDKPPAAIRRNATKRPSVSETSPTRKQESEITVFDSKRLKLEQLLSVNKSLTITPVAHFTQTLPSKPRMEMKPGERKNHSLLNNDNSKNGNSKLHNILSNLQAKQMQSLQMSEVAVKNKDPIILPDVESNTSTGSSDVVVEISRIENSHPDVQEMIINENSDFRDLSTPDEVSQDPLEVDTSKIVEEVVEPVSIKAVEVTPTPRKRGRPRKIPLSDVKPAKPSTPPALPVSALEERPQRSLRLMRERPVISVKPRGGRGRGRGGRRPASPVAAPRPPSDDDSTETVIVIETLDEDEPQRPATPARPVTPEDPTSSRIKLPRMTEALDKSSASMSMTPLSSRQRSSTDMKLFGEPSVVIESPIKLEQYMKSPELKGVRGRGRGRGTPRGRTPRGRGRGRGGGKGATYMKETMGIYGRVCGPATTTVELFEEETCMMDDNATPSKPSHLLDEDSQSSVRSSTNDSSNKMKKSKFADLFDSNKVWAASDVKEYTWPPPDVPDVEHQVMMIQEQVAMFLGVKSFKRRYSELKRRAVIGEEKDYCLRRGIVTEALCDLGITAVDASDVLDIMLSDYPHKYEEYRSYQRKKQLTESLEEADAKLDEKSCKMDIKSEKTSDKPEPPKVDPEKTRQDMAAAAIASAAEWNAMANAWRRGACADLQSNTIHRRRPPPTSAPTHCRPPHGFYPHAVLPGQYQHSYVQYTPEQLRYFPLNTVVAAPPAPPSPVLSSSESEGSWDDSSTSSDDSHANHHSAKRKKLTKVKRSSQHDKDKDESRGPPVEEVVDLCRVCKLRLEANRKYTHERFLVCSHCNAKLHPSCTELSLDTIRKCREYLWQCGECKRCGACGQPGHSMMYCELCDRGYHTHCVPPPPSTGRWHCVECSVCKSCGAREPGGLPGAPGTPGPSGIPGPGTPGTSGASVTPGAEWHHQTKRGPGGHKVYSHSLCTPCARAYRIGRYCPLCDRSFIGPKGTMQLVICKLCDRQLHQECVRATVSSLNVLDYRCAECRRGGITSRAGAVRAAPRTIATLFMAKRRFNKYAHKQYMQSRQRPPSDPEVSDPLDAENSRTDFGD